MMVPMQKYIIAIIVVVIVAAGAWYLLKPGGTPSASQQQATTTATAPSTSTYATSTYSIVYPSDYAVDDAFMNTEVNAKKPIMGVKFTIPGSMATGTNLSADTFVSVEQLPHARNCTGDIFLAANVKPSSLVDAGVSYSVATSSQGAAGNLYDETVWAISGSQPCTAVRYSVHSTDIGNYPAGTVQQFDRTSLTSAFDAIRRSLTLGAPAPAGATTTPAQQ